MSAGKFTSRSSATLGIMPRFSVPEYKFYALRLRDMCSMAHTCCFFSPLDKRLQLVRR